MGDDWPPSRPWPGRGERGVSDFNLTVLGASPAWANPGGACSGYIAACGPDRVLLECGFGVLGRLRERLPLDQLSAVVISHLHADHFMDLVPLRYGLKYGRLRADPRLPLYAPPGATEFFARLGRALDGDPHFFDHTYHLKEYSPEAPLEIGSLTFQFRKVKHYVPSYAMAIRAGRKLVFSADAAPCEALRDLARGADLFLCEAAIDRREEDDPDPRHRGHMTAVEAGAVAHEAGVRRLLLTHFRSNADRNGQAVDGARDVFGGPTELALEGRSYEV
jgi:ribonuclease BN (tRNA processing enzyme)